MEKTIYIEGKPLVLSNRTKWAVIYRDQFGKDIVPTLLPMLAAGLDIVSGVLNEVEREEDGSIDPESILRALDGDTLLDAMIHLSGLEFVDLINITWSMAKASKGDIPTPNEWLDQLNGFPVDIIAPAVVDLAFKGLVSRKNLKRLEEIKTSLQPTMKKIVASNSTPSSLQDSSEG